MQATSAALLPFKDEAPIKAYLLHAEEREARLASAGVQPMHTEGIVVCCLAASSVA